MSWFWLNIPLAGLFFLTATLIPLWLVVRHPDTRTRASGAARRPADPAVASPDGVACIRGALDPDEVRSAAAAIDVVLDRPGPLAQVA